MSGNTFFLKPRAPFRLDLTVWALRRRAENLIDRWDGNTYRRVFVFGVKPVEIAVAQTDPPDSPRLRIDIVGAKADSDSKELATALLNRMLGLQVDLSKFYRFASRKASIGPLAERFRGMRPPCFPSVFEALVNAIACQQLSLTVGIVLLNRLAATCGLMLSECGVAAHAFPRPGDLARCDPESLRPLGFSQQKVRTLIESASAIEDRKIDLENMVEIADDLALARLQRLRGVGRWSAEYMLLRGLRRWHIFPGDDVGARNNLARWLGVSEELDYDGVRRILARWKPYGGLIYFHLLLDRLAEGGYVK